MPRSRAVRNIGRTKFPDARGSTGHQGEIARFRTCFHCSCLVWRFFVSVIVGKKSSLGQKIAGMPLFSSDFRHALVLMAKDNLRSISNCVLSIKRRCYSVDPLRHSRKKIGRRALSAAVFRGGAAESVADSFVRPLVSMPGDSRERRRRFAQAAAKVFFAADSCGWQQRFLSAAALQ